MSASLVLVQRQKVSRMGIWAGARYLKNQGFTLEEALHILFNRSPRHGHA
ncbi:hypothetical protein [Cupriavidus sp. DL-D2]